MISFAKRLRRGMFQCFTMSTKTTNTEFRQRSERALEHLFDGSDLNVYEPNILNLGVGAPGPDLLANCPKIFQAATEHRMKKESSSNMFLFQYGPAIGSHEVRNEISKYISESYKSHVYGEDIVVTSGATQGLQLILSTLVDMNGYIFVDEVTYLIALDVFKQFNSMQVVPVKLTDAGVDVEDLEKRLSERKFESRNKMFWGMYYAIPTYHNPTGILFSEDVCKKLITLARKYDILISCDDVYNVLNYKGTESPKRLYAYDDVTDTDYRGNIISNGSFSKTVGPGLRLGWLEAPPRCHYQLANSGILQSGGCANQYTSGIMASLLQLGLAQSHIKTLSGFYEERMLAVCDVLRSSLPSPCTYVEPEGGYFVWVKLPDTMDSNKLLKICMDRYQVFFIVGNRFSVDGKFTNCLRISIAFHSKENLTKGVKDICSAISEYQNM